MLNYLRIFALFFLASYMMTACNSADKKPNIILILADDLGYNDVSSYRNMYPIKEGNVPTCQTPNIDELSAEGMMFTDFYCGAAVCSPSRSALMTGRNATRVGIYNWIPHQTPMHLRNDEITIAEMLKKGGYATGHFGKWHLTSLGMQQPLPNDHGFDYSFYTYNNAEPSHKNPNNFYRNNKPVGETKDYACQLVVDEAIGWLDNNRNTKDPFYINVWFNEPHMKVAAPKELTQKHTYNQEYYGAIENMDIAIGRLMTYLKDNQLDKETIIIFTSDNGSHWKHSNDPLRGYKHFNYEGGVRVPFIIKWDDAIEAGQLCNVPGSFTDILPSLAQLTGVPVPQDRVIDGVSLASLFMSNSNEVKRNHPIFFYRYFHEPILMSRDGDWCLLGYDELVTYSDWYVAEELDKIKPWSFRPNHMDYLKELKASHFELYNLKEDPGQIKNVAGEHPEIVARMKETMLQLQQEMVMDGGDWFKE